MGTLTMKDYYLFAYVLTIEVDQVKNKPLTNKHTHTHTHTHIHTTRYSRLAYTTTGNSRGVTEPHTHTHTHNTIQPVGLTTGRWGNCSSSK